jgi:phage-related protein
MKKNNSVFFDWLLLFGGAWALYQLFKDSLGSVGIAGLPNAKRKMISLDEFTKDLSKEDRDKAGHVIRLIIEARLQEKLAMPLLKHLKGRKNIVAELRDISSGARIFLSKNKEGEYILVHYFFKQSKETPDYEIEKAEKRAGLYIG